MIDGSRILGTMQRTVHHIVALGTVLTAYVLNHADITTFDDHVGSIVVAIQNWAQVCTGRSVPLFAATRIMTRKFVSTVRRAREQDGVWLSIVLGDVDGGEEAGAVAHGDAVLVLGVVGLDVRI